ncbi:YfiT family bacillithiol transferase [Cellulophaga sp. HaHaR_3_176]|uniref:YfiT family bacillithiol transferase n=1 Tax=Cellulophaga sp. HaHaR_3_176 TaxID=1942464 RepID=UPI0020B15DB8|nr:putative metal-dependent hydrolase [Cellulophaga sp. HaHaR_3_176]
MEKLQYPIGAFECPENITNKHVNKWIKDLELLPNRLSALVENLSAEQLNTAYRPEGWTVRQLVHHIADSHHHSYTRFKWALTENKPMIKAYEEKDWSELFDAKTAPINLSLDYLIALHAKLVYLLKGLSEKDLEKKFIHPESKVEIILKKNIGIYAWHSNHHLAHIQGLLDRNGW